MGVHMDLGAISVWLGFIMQDGFFFSGMDRLLSDDKGWFAMAIINFSVHSILGFSFSYEACSRL